MSSKFVNNFKRQKTMYAKLKKKTCSSEYNIFNFTKRDENNEFVSRNYIYQYDVYMNNLSQKRIYDTILFITIFCSFMFVLSDVSDLL